MIQPANDYVLVFKLEEEFNYLPIAWFEDGKPVVFIANKPVSWDDPTAVMHRDEVLAKFGAPLPLAFVGLAISMAQALALRSGVCDR